MSICPFISNGNQIMACHPACAMLVNNKCAIRTLALAKIQELANAKSDAKNENR